MKVIRTSSDRLALSTAMLQTVPGPIFGVNDTDKNCEWV